MSPIKVMVNGIPGNMAVNVARHIFADERFALVPFSLTGPEIQASEHTLESIAIRLLQPKIGPGEIEAIIQAQGPFISVDYTHPS
ncbi:MAG: dihydrodipicolinate reductase, partial [Desulfobacterales bacterium]